MDIQNTQKILNESKKPNRKYIFQSFEKVCITMVLTAIAFYSVWCFSIRMVNNDSFSNEPQKSFEQNNPMEYYKIKEFGNTSSMHHYSKPIVISNVPNNAKTRHSMDCSRKICHAKGKRLFHWIGELQSPNNKKSTNRVFSELSGYFLENYNLPSKSSFNNFDISNITENFNWIFEYFRRGPAVISFVLGHVVGRNHQINPFLSTILPLILFELKPAQSLQMDQYTKFKQTNDYRYKLLSEIPEVIFDEEFSILIDTSTKLISGLDWEQALVTSIIKDNLTPEQLQQQYSRNYIEVGNEDYRQLFEEELTKCVTVADLDGVPDCSEFITKNIGMLSDKGIVKIAEITKNLDDKNLKKAYDNIVLLNKMDFLEPLTAKNKIRLFNLANGIIVDGFSSGFSNKTIWNSNYSPAMPGLFSKINNNLFSCIKNCIQVNIKTTNYSRTQGEGITQAGGYFGPWKQLPLLNINYADNLADDLCLGKIKSKRNSISFSPETCTQITLEKFVVSEFLGMPKNGEGIIEFIENKDQNTNSITYYVDCNHRNLKNFHTRLNKCGCSNMDLCYEKNSIVYQIKPSPSSSSDRYDSTIDLKIINRPDLSIFPSVPLTKFGIPNFYITKNNYHPSYKTNVYQINNPINVIKDKDLLIEKNVINNNKRIKKLDPKIDSKLIQYDDQSFIIIPDKKSIMTSEGNFVINKCFALHPLDTKIDFDNRKRCEIGISISAEGWNTFFEIVTCSLIIFSCIHTVFIVLSLKVKYTSTYFLPFYYKWVSFMNWRCFESYGPFIDRFNKIKSNDFDTGSPEASLFYLMTPTGSFKHVSEWPTRQRLAQIKKDMLDRIQDELDLLWMGSSLCYYVNRSLLYAPILVTIYLPLSFVLGITAMIVGPIVGWCAPNFLPKIVKTTSISNWLFKPFLLFFRPQERYSRESRNKKSLVCKLLLALIPITLTTLIFWIGIQRFVFVDASNNNNHPSTLLTSISLSMIFIINKKYRFIFVLIALITNTKINAIESVGDTISLKLNDNKIESKIIGNLITSSETSVIYGLTLDYNTIGQITLSASNISRYYPTTYEWSYNKYSVEKFHATCLFDDNQRIKPLSVASSWKNKDNEFCNYGGFNNFENDTTKYPMFSNIWKPKGFSEGSSLSTSGSEWFSLKFVPEYENNVARVYKVHPAKFKGKVTIKIEIIGMEPVMHQTNSDSIFDTILFDEGGDFKIHPINIENEDLIGQKMICLFHDSISINPYSCISTSLNFDSEFLSTYGESIPNENNSGIKYYNNFVIKRSCIGCVEKYGSNIDQTTLPKEFNPSIIINDGIDLSIHDKCSLNFLSNDDSHKQYGKVCSDRTAKSEEDCNKKDGDWREIVWIIPQTINIYEMNCQNKRLGFELSLSSDYISDLDSLDHVSPDAVEIVYEGCYGHSNQLKTTIHTNGQSGSIGIKTSKSINGCPIIAQISTQEISFNCTIQYNEKSKITFYNLKDKTQFSSFDIEVEQCDSYSLQSNCKSCLGIPTTELASKKTDYYYYLNWIGMISLGFVITFVTCICCGTLGPIVKGLNRKRSPSPYYEPTTEELPLFREITRQGKSLSKSLQDSRTSRSSQEQ